MVEQVRRVARPLCGDVAWIPRRSSALMDVALDEARAALAHGDVPIGAVVVLTDDRRGRRPPATTSASTAATRPRTPRSSPSGPRRPARAVAARRLHARRDARAVPDVRGRGRERPRLGAGRVRRRRPEGRRDRQPLQPRRRSPAQPRDAGRRRRAGGRVGGAAAGVLRRAAASRPVHSPAARRSLVTTRASRARRDARAAESDGLENHCGASHRGFKSHSLRQRAARRGRSATGPDRVSVPATRDGTRWTEHTAD